MKTLLFTISGMTCDHCVKAVDAAIRGIQGVLTCDVSIGRAVVTYQPPAEKGAFLSAIRRAGAFDVLSFSEVGMA